MDVRVGDYHLDNTHNIRGGGGGSAAPGSASLSLEDDPEAIRHTLWLTTDSAFKSAIRRYARVLTNVKVKVEEEDKSDDFSREGPSAHVEAPATLTVDHDAWADRLRKLSAAARQHPLIYDSQLILAGGG